MKKAIFQELEGFENCRKLFEKWVRCRTCKLSKMGKNLDWLLYLVMVQSMTFDVVVVVVGEGNVGKCSNTGCILTQEPGQARTK